MTELTMEPYADGHGLIIRGPTLYRGLRRPSDFLSLLTFEPRPSPSDVLSIILDTRDYHETQVYIHLREDDTLPLRFIFAIPFNLIKKVQAFLRSPSLARALLWEKLIDPYDEWHRAHIERHITDIRILPSHAPFSTPCVIVQGDSTLCQFMEKTYD